VLKGERYTKVTPVHMDSLVYKCEDFEDCDVTSTTS